MMSSEEHSDEECSERYDSYNVISDVSGYKTSLDFSGHSRFPASASFASSSPLLKSPSSSVGIAVFWDGKALETRRQRLLRVMFLDSPNRNHWKAKSGYESSMIHVSAQRKWNLLEKANEIKEVDRRLKLIAANMK